MTKNYAQMINQFEDLSLDAAGFSHIDHVAVAYEMLRRYDFLEAVQRYSSNLNAIATRAGAAQKFHVTTTVAFLSIIAERMAASSASDVHGFLDENPDLIRGNPLLRHYSRERLQSDAARTAFLLPDRQP